MKIRVKDMMPEDIFPRKIAEKLVGCEISLVTMGNLEGEDSSILEKVLQFPEAEIKHEVDVISLLHAIQEKHGEVVYEEIMNLLASLYGGRFLMSTIGIPVAYCEVIPEN